MPDVASVPRFRESPKTLGFLSNISPEKGVFEFLDVVERLHSRSVNVNTVLAGPFQDSHTESSVISRLRSIPNAHYVGAVYGPDKANFLQSIDVLLFPTKYVNEAEPITILEALQRGVPVLARARGCIKDLVSDREGLVVESPDFVSIATEQIIAWKLSPNEFQSCSAAAAKKFSKLKSRDSVELETLLCSFRQASCDERRPGTQNE
jgi:glycosyltransferase involved in cell wall biosynthesis